MQIPFQPLHRAHLMKMIKGSLGIPAPLSRAKSSGGQRIYQEQCGPFDLSGYSEHALNTCKSKPTGVATSKTTDNPCARNRVGKLSRSRLPITIAISGKSLPD